MPRPFLLQGSPTWLLYIKTHLYSPTQPGFWLYERVTHKSEFDLGASWIILSTKCWEMICHRQSLFPLLFYLTWRWQEKIFLCDTLIILIACMFGINKEKWVLCKCGQYWINASNKKKSLHSFLFFRSFSYADCHYLMDNSLNLRLHDAAFVSQDQSLFPLPEMLCYRPYKIWDDNSGTLIGQKLDHTTQLIRKGFLEKCMRRHRPHPSINYEVHEARWARL